MDYGQEVIFHTIGIRSLGAISNMRASRLAAVSVSFSIGGIMFTLGELDTLPIDFDEKLWQGTVDNATVYSDERVVFHFRDGKKIVTRL